MLKQRWIAGCLTLPILSGCAVAPPTAPSIAVLPGQGKSYSAFQADDYACRDVAARSVGYSNTQAVTNQAAVGTAIAGTVVGAATGAVIGAAAGNAGTGAAIGAWAGLLVGSATGASTGASMTATELQRQYDVVYAQCMSAKGNNVPPLPSAATSSYPPSAVGYYPYVAYPPLYAFYPGYGYLYPNVSIVYGWGWNGWHHPWHRH